MHGRFQTLRLRIRKPSALLLRSATLSLTVALAGCAGTKLPASVKGGECRVFERPAYVVLGKTQYDQDWVDGNVEAGIGGCQWQRPAPRPPELDAAPVTRQVPAAVKPKAKRKLIQRIRDGVWPRSNPAPVVVVPAVTPAPPPVVVAAPPPPPPRDPVMELLHPRGQ